jgi:hypothetical protein
MSTSDSVVIPNNKSKEPAVATGTIVGTLTAVVFLVLQLFPELRDNSAVFKGFVIACFLLPIITGFLIRRKVWSPKSVQEIVEEVEKATWDSIQLTKDGKPLGEWKAPPPSQSKGFPDHV